MGNAPRRAERIRRETIGGEEFVSEGLEAVHRKAAATAPAQAAPTALGTQAQRLEIIKGLRTMEAGYLQTLKELGESRALSIARQRVEEATLWAIKHVSTAK